jgi:hypothetical protein
MARERDDDDDDDDDREISHWSLMRSMGQAAVSKWLHSFIHSIQGEGQVRLFY